MDLYDRITKILNDKKISRRTMAKDIDISYATLNSLFRRKSNRIKLDIVQDIADYLGTTVDYLAFGEEFVPSKEVELLKIFNRLPENKKELALSYLKFLESEDIK